MSIEKDIEVSLRNLAVQVDVLMVQRGPMCPEPGCGLTTAACDRKQLRHVVQWIEDNVKDGKALVAQAFECFK